MKNILIRSIATAAGRLALAAVSALVIAACAEDISPETATPSAGTADNPNAITFTVSDSAAASGVAFTRIAPGTVNRSELRDMGFGVFAAHTGLHPYASSTISSNFMYNEKISYDVYSSKWTYSPVKYWPNGEVGASNDYVSFFAYGPYCSSPGGTGDVEKCIIDFSLPYETGDPWLVYQLGGSREDYESSQVDLVYAVKKDQQKSGSSVTVPFDFKHALACSCDQLTVTCSDALQTKLKTMASTQMVVLSLDKVVLNYKLTNKGKLILNNSDQPTWKAVDSDNSMVHRIKTLTASHALATAALGGSSITLMDYSASDIGLFYIPLEIGDDPQKVDVVLSYTVYIDGTPSFSSAISASYGLNEISAGENRNFRIVLSENIPLDSHSETSAGMRIFDIDDQTYTGSEIKPNVTVVDNGGHVLTKDVDYELTYQDNVAVRSSSADNPPTVIATGLGDYAGLTARKAFTIKKVDGSVYFNMSAYEIKKGQSFDLSTPGAPHVIKSGDGILNWTSSNSKVVSITYDSDGNPTFRADGVGSSLISVNVEDGDGYTYSVPVASYTVNVYDDATISFEHTGTINVLVGDKYYINNLTNTGDGKVVFSFNGTTDAAEIDPNTGLVTLKASGSATVKATVSDSPNYRYNEKEKIYILNITEY